MKTNSAIIWLILIICGCQSHYKVAVDIYTQNNRIDAAEDMLLSAHEKYPMNSEIPFLLGLKIYLPKNDFRKMDEMFEKSLNIDKKYLNEISTIRSKHQRQLAMISDEAYKNKELNEYPFGDVNSNLEYIIEDFDAPFKVFTGYGKIPSTWSAFGSEKIAFSAKNWQATGSQCLQALGINDPSLWTILSCTFYGTPGDIVNLRIQSSVSTTNQGQATLTATEDQATVSKVSIWYSDSYEMRTLELNDVEVHLMENCLYQ